MQSKDIKKYDIKHYIKTSILEHVHVAFDFPENHVAAWSWQWFGLFTSLFPKNWVMGKIKPFSLKAK